MRHTLFVMPWERFFSAMVTPAEAWSLSELTLMILSTTALAMVLGTCLCTPLPLRAEAPMQGRQHGGHQSPR